MPDDTVLAFSILNNQIIVPDTKILHVAEVTIVSQVT